MRQQINKHLSELKLPFRNAIWLSIPPFDKRWTKYFRIDLTATGGADPDATLLLGIAGQDPYYNAGKIIVENITLEPDDAFSFNNIAYDSFLRKMRSDTPYNTEHAQQTVDVAVTVDRMHPQEIYVNSDELFAMTFVNGGAALAGLEGVISGRILRTDTARV
jgi:hypothetical protein